MSIQSKLIGGCDALLLALVAVMQTGLLVTAVQAWVDRPAARDGVAEQRYVEVVVVEAARISRS